MTYEEIREELLRIVGGQLNEPTNDIEDNSTLEMLGADSLDRIEIIMKVEEKFDIEIEDVEVEKCKTFGDLVDYTINKIGEGSK